MESSHLIEQMVLTAEGRRDLGYMAATDDLAGPLMQYLLILDISQEWRDDIERARLEKLRDMQSRDGDAGKLVQDADGELKATLAEQVERPRKPAPATPVLSDEYDPGPVHVEPPSFTSGGPEFGPSSDMLPR